MRWWSLVGVLVTGWLGPAASSEAEVWAEMCDHGFPCILDHFVTNEGFAFALGIYHESLLLNKSMWFLDL